MVDLLRSHDGLGRVFGSSGLALLKDPDNFYGQKSKFFINRFHELFLRFMKLVKEIAHLSACDIFPVNLFGLAKNVLN